MVDLTKGDTALLLGFVFECVPMFLIELGMSKSIWLSFWFVDFAALVTAFVRLLISATGFLFTIGVPLLPFFDSVELGLWLGVVALRGTFGFAG